jgi:hypothetical protein
MVAVKESLGDIKKEERMTIKEISLKNQKVIEESRRALLDKKKQVVMQLKQWKENSRMETIKQN